MIVRGMLIAVVVNQAIYWGLYVAGVHLNNTSALLLGICCGLVVPPLVWSRP